MKIGILKEPDNENRVAMLPEEIAGLVKNNNQIFIEKGAGERAFASDEDYKTVGAEISTREEVIKEVEIILGVNPPDESSIKKMNEGQILVSTLNAYSNQDFILSLSKKGITSFGLELVPRTTRAQAMDVLSSMATIAGYLSVLDAARNLPKFFPMFMSAAGTIKPAKVLILGAGVAGLQAIAVARKLGAVVEVFDVRSAVKEEVQSLGGKFIEVEGAKEDKDAGGYAVEQSEEFKKKQQQMIQEHVITANVVICTAQIPGTKAPVLILKSTVEQMQKGSVVVDLAASTGGNCEVTENDKTIIYNGVKIIGNSAYPSEMPSDASKMFGRNIINFLKILLDEEGNLNLNFEDEIISGACATHQKEIINERLKTILNS